MRHTLSWLTWALSAAVIALLVRNPLYITLVVLATWLVYVSVAHDAPLAGSWRSLLRLGLVIWIITIPFTALMNHQGDLVLFTLPPHWPLIGGPITLEAVLFGAVSGYALWTLLFIFAAFNLAVDATRLIRSAPGFLYLAGVVTTIALTFIPQMLQSGREIREAQRIRGHRFRTWRDSLPLAIPLLTTGFERAVQLAESMEARGFGGQLTGLAPRHMARLRALMALSLLAILVGLLVRVFWRTGAFGANLLVATAAMALVYAFYDLGRHVRRTRYRRQRWGAGDSAIAACSLLALGAVLVMARVAPGQLAYSPLTGGSLLPSFSLWIGLSIALLAIPGLIAFAEVDPSSPGHAAAPDLSP